MAAAVVFSAAAATSILQEQFQHEDELSHSRLLFQSQIENEARIHEAELRALTERHCVAARLERQLHVSLMAHRTHISNKEAIRDVLQQRNELVQTMMIVTTLMFGCAYTTLVDGGRQVPHNSNAHVTTAYSFFISSALLLLILCIVCLLTMHARMATFDLHRPLKRYKLCGHQHPTFNDFFTCQFAALYRQSLRLFYVGCLLTLSGCSVLQCAKYFYVFDSPGASVCFTVCVGTALLVPIFGEWLFPSTTMMAEQGSGGLYDDGRPSEDEVSSFSPDESRLQFVA